MQLLPILFIYPWQNSGEGNVFGGGDIFRGTSFVTLDPYHSWGGVFWLVLRATLENTTILRRPDE